MQQLGYILATFVLLAFIVAAVIVLTRRRKKRGVEYDLRYDRGNVISGGEISLENTELRACSQEPLNSDYKNNLLKERDMTKECNKDFDGKLWK